MTANLFSNLPDNIPDELIQTLVVDGNLRIERIVSRGHASPEGLWYDQPSHEWVIVLRGAATIRFADAEDPINLKCGDSLQISAHRRHRVEWTTPDEPTIWLAVHYGE